MGQTTGLPVSAYFVNGRFFIVIFDHFKISYQDVPVINYVLKENSNFNHKLKIKFEFQNFLIIFNGSLIKILILTIIIILAVLLAVN